MSDTALFLALSIVLFCTGHPIGGSVALTVALVSGLGDYLRLRGPVAARRPMSEWNWWPFLVLLFILCGIMLGIAVGLELR